MHARAHTHTNTHTNKRTHTNTHTQHTPTHTHPHIHTHIDTSGKMTRTDLEAERVPERHVPELASRCLLLRHIALARRCDSVGQLRCERARDGVEQRGEDVHALLACLVPEALETVHVLALLLQQRLAPAVADDMLPRR